MIMDERTREFMGEGLRWYDLKRTGTLISRSKAFNPWIGALNYIKEHHYLRPIPLSEIDLATMMSLRTQVINIKIFNQKPGFDLV